ncbi:FliO/MopB family protein [Pollutimonas harenae]|uniref:FliO/MopB family protein n=1 Tax=Pollutimonas harenae TaxID=657015 RepID=UPI00352DE418
MRTGNASGLRVIGSQSLGARNYVAMVEVEDARLVLGISGHQITLLHTLPPSPPIASGLPGVAGRQENAGPGFAAALGKVLKGR